MLHDSNRMKALNFKTTCKDGKIHSKYCIIRPKYPYCLNCLFNCIAYKCSLLFQQPLCTEMAEELRFAVSCCAKSTKPVKKKRQDVPDYYMDGNGTTLMPLNSNFGPRPPIGFKDDILH